MYPYPNQIIYPPQPQYQPTITTYQQTTSSPFPSPFVRQHSFPPNTPAYLSHASSPVQQTIMSTPTNHTIPQKRHHTGDLPGPSRRQDRKQSVDSHHADDNGGGKKKRVSLSCAQCESLPGPYCPYR